MAARNPRFRARGHFFLAVIYYVTHDGLSEEALLDPYSLTRIKQAYLTISARQSNQSYTADVKQSNMPIVVRKGDHIVYR